MRVGFFFRKQLLVAIPLVSESPGEAIVRNLYEVLGADVTLWLGRDHYVAKWFDHGTKTAMEEPVYLERPNYSFPASMNCEDCGRHCTTIRCDACGGRPA